MLADALKPYGGIVMWRAFVYSPTDSDRAKQAYLEFMPLDGQFHDNVIVQIKELKEIIDYYKCSCSAQKQRIDELYKQLHRYQEDKPEELPFG